MKIILNPNEQNLTLYPKRMLIMTFNFHLPCGFGEGSFGEKTTSRKDGIMGNESK
jgi:hypothetical protein